jgi:hexosaminidase
MEATVSIAYQPVVLETPDAAQPNPIDNLIPKPVSVKATGERFLLTSATQILIDKDNSVELVAVATYFAERLGKATGYKITITPISDSTPVKGNILLTLHDAAATLGDEGYELAITSQAVAIRAAHPAGIFYGIQTLRQLFPPSIEANTVQAETWELPTGVITDQPRFAWRGVMLDVARHFFGVADLKRYIDLLAAYKINRLHLHLTDDQGWRIVINRWEKLATYGGSTAVGGGKGGYYTQKDYAEIVAYAQSRYITVVPEVDMPGHTNAALASYPELNCDGVAPALYTQTKVGFSSLCVEKEVTYQFIEDVVRELAALTPGPYLHIGGDESQATKPEDYLKFMTRVQEIVRNAGKRPVGWEEMAQIELHPETVIQHWTNDKFVKAAVSQGAKVIMSPAPRAYMDMKYDRSTKLGLDWAGLVSVKTGYDWNPSTEVSGIAETDILGVEAPLWSETLETLADVEYMTFPRVLGYAEIGWSPAQGRGWDEYQLRLDTHAARLTAQGINFFKGWK